METKKRYFPLLKYKMENNLLIKFNKVKFRTEICKNFITNMSLLNDLFNI